MTFLELASKRISVRGYRPAPVEPDLVDQVLEAGRLAPSACNRQPYHFIVIRDEAMRRSLSEAYGKEWFWTAPVVIAVCVEPAKAWSRSDGKNYAYVDGAIAVDHMTLCAAELGLGTCWIGAFNPAALYRLLGLPEGMEVVAMTPLGYPADAGRPKTRKPLSELVHRERW